MKPVNDEGPIRFSRQPRRCRRCGCGEEARPNRRAKNVRRCYWVAEDLCSRCFEAARKCRVCGCTSDDCSGCVERTGQACYWVDADLCSACVKRWKPTRR
jgi:hypothetical protein